MSQRKSYKSRALLGIVLLAVVLILLNILSSSINTRIDLTKEGRFSLTEASKKVLVGLDDIVTVKVYLEGEFPAGFKRLRNATQDMLDEFRAYAGTQLQYEFIDPFDGVTDAEEKKAIYEQLTEKGLLPQRLIDNREDYSEKVIFPAALVIYRNREYPVNLLEDQRGRSSGEVLNNSVAMLEFKLGDAIQKTQKRTKQRIAFLTGHGELEGKDIADIQLSLSTYYLISNLDLSLYDIIPPQVDVVVIPKPQKAFSELDKFKLDQFLMNGGKIMCLVEKIDVNLDSLNRRGKHMALPQNYNLEDMLFKYGIRINDDLIQDLQNTPIPLVVGVDQAGNSKQQRLFPWYYNPLLTNINSKHPITKNLSGVAGEYMGTIDTIRQAGIKKEILLSSSEYSKVLPAPILVDINLVKEEPNKAQYNQSNKTVGVALEGVFPSVFQNRIAPTTMAILDTIDGFELRDESVPTKMIVFSDGDLIRNDYDNRNDRPRPLGYNKYLNETFANKDLIMNSIEWLLDDSGIIVARSKDVKMRLLDAIRIKEEKTFWQVLNIAGPIIFILLLGGIYNFIRRRRLAK